MLLGLQEEAAGPQERITGETGESWEGLWMAFSLLWGWVIRAEF